MIRLSYHPGRTRGDFADGHATKIRRQASPSRRTEDRRLLMGHGRYTSDVSLPHQLHGQVLRAPHAHARIARIETRAAAAAPGVRLVLSAAELAAAGARPYPCIAPVLNRDGTPCHMTEWPALAVERVRYVGEGVAFIVADTISQARDAAELVEVDYEPLPAVTGTAATIGSGIEVWPDAPANLCCDWAFGDPGATEAVFARAHHVTTPRSRQQPDRGRAHGDARHRRRVPAGRRALFPPHLQPERPRHAWRLGRCPRRAHQPPPPGHARRGWGLRHEGGAVPRICPRPGRRAPHGQAREVDCRPGRGFPIRHPRPRPCDPGRAGTRRRGGASSPSVRA